MSNELLLRVAAGSRLYGYSTESSDYDFFEVYSSAFPPVAPKVAPIKTRHTIVDDIDTTQMSLSHFLEVASSGSHQALDAMFAEEPTVDKIEGLRESFRVGYEVIPTYERIITKFALAGTPRKQRHAIRTAFNLEDILKTGRYSPKLSAERIEYIMRVHVLPPEEFKQELMSMSPIIISHYFI